MKIPDGDIRDPQVIADKLSKLSPKCIPPKELRCCYNCVHRRVKAYIHCQCSGPYGGDIANDPMCTFENKYE